MKTKQNNGLNKLRGMGRLAAMGCMLLTAGLAARAEDLSAWQKRMPIAFSGYTPSGGDETLTNFPVLVVLSNTTDGVGYDYTDFLSPPYGDLRFAAADKTTALDFEVESWDTNGLSHVWVRVPELTAETAIYALWGKSEVSVPPCTTNGATWMNGFSGIWHLSETNGITSDSSSNRHSAIITGTGVQGATGQVAGAYRFSGGSSSYVTLAITNGATVTISAWAQNTLAAPADMLWSKNKNPGPDLFFGGGKILMNSGDGYANPFCNIPGTVTQLHHYVTVSDPAQTELFIDGRSAGKAAYKSLAGSPFRISSGWGQNYDWHGVVDEFQISSAVRSTNWIWASYLNTASNGVFTAYGIPESQGFPSVSNADGATNVTSIGAWLNGTLSSTGTSDTAVFAYWGTTDGGTNASAWANTNTWDAPQIPGDFTFEVMALTSNTTYYYQFSATNQMGRAWPNAASVFITGEVWIDKLSDASEIGPTPGTFTVHRASAATNEALIVTYMVGGTAISGTDYTALSGTVTIPQGEDSVAIEVTPIFDHFVEGSETVEVTLVPGPYMIGSASNATVEIEDYGLVTRTWGGGGANAVASNPANWVGGEAPIAGDGVVLDATTNKNMTWDLNLPVQSWTQDGYTGTVTIATVYPGKGAFTNFAILGDCVISNGVWVHAANTASPANRLKVSIGGDLTLGTNASIDVSNKGYPIRSGLGFTSGDNAASHGGYGWGGGPTYGSITEPTHVGSGGRESAGGGAILMTVGGTIQNDGLIASDGGPTTWGGGSGGSIWLMAGDLVGTGAIRANGSIAGDRRRAAAGGRIALMVTNAGADFTSFANTVSAYSMGSGGCAGTIYREKSADGPGKGELIVDNAGGGGIGYGVYNTDLNGREAVTYEFSRIILTNGGVLNIGSDDTLIASNTLFIGQNALINGIWISGGTLSAPPVFAYSNFFIGISGSGSTFSPSTTLAISTNAIFLVNQPHAMTCDVTIQPGGLLTHTPNPSAQTESYKIDLTVNGALFVENGGSVDVTGRGFPVNYGPGTPLVGSVGASHGGLGVGGLSCYGSLVAPTNLGSGGRSTGAGGGAVRLAVSGVVSNGGGILANAAMVTANTGAGGSVAIIAGSLAGSGPIQANSATNVTGSNPGGGGRVAVTVTNSGESLSTYVGPITAYGGRKSTISGGAGTVYLRDHGQGLADGTLIVDNDNLNGLGTEISSNVTDATVANVCIQRNGYLLLADNQTLTVSGTWSNSATFAGLTDSAVIFSGGVGSTSLVYGATTFKGLTCTQAGHTLVFAAESTNAVAAYGRLILRGDAATNLVLRSTVPGTAWHLNVDALAEQDIEFVDVAHSDAAEGAEIIAKNSVGDDQDNVNWMFLNVTPGETIVWTGNDNTLWTGVGNWDRPRTPVETDVIVIPGGCPNYPVFDAVRTVNQLEIQSGGAVFLNGYDLTMTHAAVIAGALTASGTEIVTFLADVNFTGGTFTPAFSMIVLAGDSAQSVNLGEQTFYKVRMDNSAAAVSFTAGFTATELLCEAPSGTRNLNFAQNATVTLRDLVLRGASPAATNILLRSTSSGQKWKLAVSGYRSVRGVDVQDSDASVGLLIPALSSVDSGGNVNWTFGVAPTVWTPTSGNNFHTAANWTPTVVPDATTRVLVESGITMTITGTVSILDLTVGGGTSMASMTVNGALTVAENAVVLDKGTLTWNRPGVVSNDLVVLAGGTLTHAGNTDAEVNKLTLTVMGNAWVDPNGVMDVTGKGYVGGKGPGAGTGAGYGGRGSDGYSGGIPSGLCYGSILAPIHLGSSGAGGYGAPAGGGAIRLMVSGTLRQDGFVCANGATFAGDMGSGGSIWLTVGAVTGIGAMQANGGESTGGHSEGGGGRLSMVVTNAGADFFLYTGTVQARSTRVMPSGTSAGGAGAGTIYKQRAADRPGRGTVLVDNCGLVATGPTDVPAYTNGVAGEADRAVFNVANRARLRLTDDFIVGDIWLETANAWLDLGSNTLTVNAREHPLGLGSVLNPGAVIWTGLPPGVLIIVK